MDLGLSGRRAIVTGGPKGLGLAIAKSVAEAHEGFLDIVDTPGWSTTFRVFLPLRTTAASSRTA